MEREKVILTAAGVLLFCLIMTTTSFSQVWDNKWFKLKGRAQGYVVNEEGNLSRASFSGISYVFFNWNLANHRYDLNHWVKNDDGDWVSFNGILPSPIGNNEVLWRDIYTRLQKGADWVWVYAVTRVRVRHDESGSIVHARFVSLGCESPMGSIDGQNFGGKCKFRGKMVEPTELPFTP